MEVIKEREDLKRIRSTSNIKEVYTEDNIPVHDNRYEIKFNKFVHFDKGNIAPLLGY